MKNADSYYDRPNGRWVVIAPRDFPDWVIDNARAELLKVQRDRLRTAIGDYRECLLEAIAALEAGKILVHVVTGKRGDIPIFTATAKPTSRIFSHA